MGKILQQITSTLMLMMLRNMFQLTNCFVSVPTRLGDTFQFSRSSCAGYAISKNKCYKSYIAAHEHLPSDVLDNVCYHPHILYCGCLLLGRQQDSSLPPHGLWLDNTHGQEICCGSSANYLVFVQVSPWYPADGKKY